MRIYIDRSKEKQDKAKYYYLQIDNPELFKESLKC